MVSFTCSNVKLMSVSKHINTPTARISKYIRSDQVFITAYWSSINSTDPSPMNVKAGHFQPASETPFKWRFTGGPKVA